MITIFLIINKFKGLVVISIMVDAAILTTISKHIFKICMISFS